jgi:hypothetical protein
MALVLTSVGVSLRSARPDSGQGTMMKVYDKPLVPESYILDIPIVGNGIGETGIRYLSVEFRLPED